MSGFSSDWLALREPLDAAARDAGLAQRFAAALGSTTRRIVDLGAGTGANFRLLAPLIGGNQDWLLLDHDPSLVAAQRIEIARWAQPHGWRVDDIDGGLSVDAGTFRWRLRSRQLDLQQSLEQLDLQACDGVTTTAFLDLVSTDWIERLCTLLATACRPLLATLTVDGRRQWQPPLDEDARLQDAFLRHQGGDKGFGPALGTAAVDATAAALAARGFTVNMAESDWQIGQTHPDLLRQMVDEAADVAAQTEPASASAFAAWAAQRHRQIDDGSLAMVVGHRDLLALPPSSVQSA